MVRRLPAEMPPKLTDAWAPLSTSVGASSLQQRGSCPFSLLTTGVNEPDPTTSRLGAIWPFRTWHLVGPMKNI